MTTTGGQLPTALDRLPDERLGIALDVLRFLRATIRGNCRSWWYASGTDEFRAVFDLFNYTRQIHAREIAGGVRVILRRRKAVRR